MWCYHCHRLVNSESIVFSNYLSIDLTISFSFYSVRTSAVLPHILPKLVHPPLSYVSLCFFFFFICSGYLSSAS